MKYSEFEYFKKFSDIVISYLSTNYDYCYLKAMHEKNRTEGAETIIVGSSHAMNGINQNDLKSTGKTIQFSISSQDLFYDFLHIKKAVTEGKEPIKRCIIGLGYYMMYQDVSKSTLVRGLVPNVYMNLFGDEGKHNFLDAERREPFSNIKIDTESYPPELVKPWAELWSNRVMLELSSYYNSLKDRVSSNMLGVQKVNWKTLSEEDKRKVAIERVEKGHNKHIKYKEARQENEKILYDMVRFLSDHGIRTIFLITPYTKYYNEYINPEYKPDIVEALDKLEFPVEFLDLNDFQDEFTDDDFLDSDHLNDEGAKKATTLLDSYIELTEGEN